MPADDFLTLSLETVIAASPMLGHKLEDRSKIREAQAPDLVERFRRASAVPLGSERQKRMFLVAPLDVLVVNAGEGCKQFHVTEVNGTGIGGFSNLPLDVIQSVLRHLGEMAEALPGPSPVALVAISGIESHKNPRHNHLVHEKLLYVEAMKRGLERKFGAPVRVLTMALLDQSPEALDTDRPTVVLGYIKEFLNALGLRRDGRLHLSGRPVDAGVNDRFCLNVISRFGHQVDLSRWATMNRTFMAGADKGFAYGLLNEYLAGADKCGGLFPRRVRFARAGNRLELVATVLNWARHGRGVVIKAQGTGLGHGIEFFLDPEEDTDAIISRIDHSIRVTEHYYGAVGGAFPYTVCEFVDTCTVPREGHPLFGHKFEVRVVVFRDGDTLQALPAITKISSQGYEADKPTRLSLINNITTSAEARKRAGSDFMHALSNHETLGLLGISVEDMERLCVFCSGFVRHILDQAEAQPERFGLAGVWGGLSDQGADLVLKRA